MANLPEKAQAYNFGPDSDSTASVKDVIEIARQCFGGGKVKYSNINQGPKESAWLSLNIEKSRKDLGIQPRWTLDETISHVISWYVEFSSGKDPITLCNQQIDLYESAE